MNIVNLVGKLSFDTDLKGAEKFLAISKKCNEEAKELRKNLKKAGEDEIYTGLAERAKAFKEQMKNIRAQGYASPRTMVLQGYLKDLQERKAQLQKEYRSMGLSYSKKMTELTEKGDKVGLRGARLAKAKQYLTYRTRRATLDDKIADIQTKLKGSQASDKATLDELLGRKQAGTDVLEKARDERKKQILDENKLTKEKIENLKEESARNKERAKDEQKAHKNNLFTLGRFALAVGSAVTVLKGIESVYRNTVNTNASYMNAPGGSDIAPERLEDLTTNLFGLGLTGVDKKTLTKTLGITNVQTGLRKYGEMRNAGVLAMADINPMQAMSAKDLLTNAYRSYFSGTNGLLVERALSAEGLDGSAFINMFKINKQKGLTPDEFSKRLGASQPGANFSAKAGVAEKAGWFEQQKSRATGLGGLMWSNFIGKGQLPGSTLADVIAGSISGQQSQGGNINYNKNITVNTNNAEAVKEAINDEMTSFKILPLTNGGTN